MYENNQRMFEKEYDMWVSACGACESINEAYEAMIYSINYHDRAWNEITKSVSNMTSYVDKIEEKNPGLLDELFGRRSSKILKGDTNG